ncbi:helix-turn-helix transcriptional regulator [Chitinophaga sp. Cy-1792]|uniref:helix-turn-helix transcriptional regulator n=1 Tax=Chitinophaga sp. Cy-1792 TaxID=2608339 RepID=UPI001421BA6D|nr:helix-turn-helix transcriptional regulator [Chitinophaga sp. Cy-1792]NIG56376.1 helix-turn-helix transcriptional regulator [Chitinophaga sp. Cy-1792]
MDIQYFSPGLLLQPYIKHYFIINSEEGVVNHVLPDTSITLSFKLSGDVRHNRDGDSRSVSNIGIAGIRKTAQEVAYQQHTSMLLVAFREGAAAAFFRTPMHELNGFMLGLHELLPQQELRDVSEQLQETIGASSRIKIIEDWLSGLLQPISNFGMVQQAVAAITAGKGNIRITDLVKDLYVSRDPFEKKFRQAVGTSPKQFAAIVRLRHIISAYDPAKSLTSLAYESGYFDQAHFTKDFKQLTGLAPHDFFRTERHW